VTTDDPGTTVPVLSDFVIERSITLLYASTSVPLLLPGGSGSPGGPEMVTVLDNEPVAPAFTNPLTVYVIILPTGIVIPESFMSPVPAAENPTAPPVPVAVQLIPERLDGKLSLITTPVARDGPLLVALIM